MTIVGHTLAGVTLACLVMPRDASWRVKAGLIGLFAVLGNAPDLPFPSWGHDRYDISHSIFSTSVAIVLVLSLLAGAKELLHFNPARRFVVVGVLAWYSHLLLDTFYNHGKGLAMFWPLSRAKLALPLPWFEVL